MNYFAPSQASGLALRGEMSSALWLSAYELLADKSVSLSPDDFGVTQATAADFAAYFDLAFPLPKDEELTDSVRNAAQSHLRARFTEIQNNKSKPVINRMPRVTTLDRTFYKPAIHEQLIRWMDIEPVNPMGLVAGANDELDKARQHIARVFDVLEKSVPDLFAETILIVDEIVSVRADGSQRFDYDGGSSFALWGLILINADAHPGWPRYCKTIVHEAAHNVLFALARKEALVLNDPEESYGSPLRDDPRPMDGIFHAAYVAARESLAFDRILAWHDRSDGLTADEHAAIVDLFETSVITFWQCDEAMQRDVSLSPLGEAILADCKDYMSRNFALVSA